MKNRGALLGVEVVSLWCPEPGSEFDPGDLGGTPDCRPVCWREHAEQYLTLSNEVTRQAAALAGGVGMDVIYERCCGLDIHKKTVVACRVTPDARQIKTFGTMTDDLLELGDWLLAAGVTHVAMESTGVYWKPIYNLLEGLDLTLLVVNAQHIKAVPGRKTDVKDAEWIADLLHHGLLQGSYIPDRPQRELRELVRYRRSLVQQRSQVVNRIQKVLEGANIKLSSVASNVVGASGRAMLAAMVSGTDDPQVLAELAKGRLQDKRPALERALRWRRSRTNSLMARNSSRVTGRRTSASSQAASVVGGICE
jgi:transposase